MPKRKSKSIVSMASAASFDLFGPPQLLAGEDPANYNELLAQVCAAVKPVDVIEQMFVLDLVSATWELLRWRRLKAALLSALGCKQMAAFLGKKLDYEHYAATFEQFLANTLQEMHPNDQPLSLAHRCALGETAARKKADELLTRRTVDQRLAGDNFDVEKFLNLARADRAKELAQQYVRHEACGFRRLRPRVPIEGGHLFR